MTGTAATPQKEYAVRWGEAISAVLGQISRAAWHAALGQASQSAEVAKPRTVLQFALDRALSGKSRFSLLETDALKLVSLFTGTEPEPAWNSEQQEAIEELFRQFGGQLSTSVKPDMGEVVLRLEPATEIELAGEEATICLDGPGGQRIELTLQNDAVLAAALLAATAPAEPTRGANSLAPSNLELLMDVELAVTLRFGEREMKLQDILDLQSGSVIELDREIQEPVDLLLDGRVIARGNVVIVDGNYGLRVSQLSAPPVGDTR